MNIEYIWLDEQSTIKIHSQLVMKFGGLGGVRDLTLLKSSLARPKNLLAYGQPSIFDLSASYALAIVKNHPFIDGNKRIAFMSAYVFLSLNGYNLVVDQIEAFEIVLKLADGSVNDITFSKWLEENSCKIICIKY